LVTGASGGIGRAIARSLHRHGAHLILTGQNTELLEQLRSELADRAQVIAADLSDPDELERLVEEAGQVDVLVANAGLGGNGPIEGFSPEQIGRMLDVNLQAPILLARALVPAMVERGTGHVVLISSGAGKIALPLTSLYCATKFGLRGFGLALREDLRATGVGVTIVFPGMISGAGMFAETGVEAPRGVPTRSPEQVAEAVIIGIEKDKPEIDVAPLLARLGGRLFGLAPSLLAAVSRRRMKAMEEALAKSRYGGLTR